MNVLPILGQTTSCNPLSELTQLTGGEPASGAKGTYAFVTLGCAKNLVDSETMLGSLAANGYQLVQNPDGADFVIVNTCGFIDASRIESKSVIGEMLDLKRSGRTKGVIVAGCLPERMGPGLLQEIPEIDHVVGVFGRDEIAQVADRLVGGSREQREVFRPAPIKALDDRTRLRITPKHFAYLKISEGCDRTCTFCAIPKMRGKHLTKPIEMIIDEARQLVASGVRELVLVAQDTTYYGMDLYGRVRLAELLRELDQLPGLDWIRLLYLYPINFSDELIDTIAGAQRIIPYLDMPLQHINDRMLRRMQRRVNRQQTEELIAKLRDRIPNLVMRTTFIVGFPGETQAEFDELQQFVRDQRFERMGVFTYSFEPGTPATRLPEHLPEAVKEERRDRLMEIQQPITFEFTDSLLGYELDAFVDRRAADGSWIGRCYFDAPEIDANVIIDGSADLAIGQKVAVELVARQGYDVMGVPVVDAEDENDSVASSAVAE